MKNFLLSTALAGAAYFTPALHANAQGNGGVQFDTTNSVSIKVAPTRSANNSSGFLADYNTSLTGFVGKHHQFNERLNCGALAGPSYNLSTKELGAQGRLYGNYMFTKPEQVVHAQVGLFIDAEYSSRDQFTTEIVPTLSLSPHLSNELQLSFLNNAQLTVQLPFENNLTISDPTVSIGYTVPLTGKLSGRNLRAGARMDFE